MTPPARHRLFEAWGEFLLIGMVGLLPLFVALDLQDTFDLPKLTLMYEGVILLLALKGLQAMDRGVLSVRRTPLDLPIVVFLAVAMLSSFQSIEPLLSIYGAYRIYVFGLMPMSAFALLYWLVAQMSSPSLRRKMAWTVVGSGAVVGLYAYLQYSGHEMLDRMPRVLGGRPWSSMGNSLYMGAACMMASAMGTALIVKPKQTLLRKCLLWVLLCFNGVGLWLSLSRSAWVGLAAGLCLIAGMASRRFFQQVIPLFAAMGLIGGAAVFASSPLRARAATLFSVHESSNAARIEGWKAGFKIWQASPFLGSGPDTFFEAFRRYRTLAYLRAAGPEVTQADAHNDEVQIMSTMGTFGLLAFLWLLSRAGREGWRGLQASSGQESDFLITLGMAGALMALLVQDQFNFSSVTTSAWAAVLAGLFVWPPQAEKSIVLPMACRSKVARVLWVLGLGGIGYAGVRPVLADFAFQQGFQQAAMGRILQSLDWHREAVGLNPRIEAYKSELANRCRQAAQLSPDGPLKRAFFDEAWSAAQSATQDHPGNPDAWNNQGVAAMWLTQMSGRPLMPEARAAFEAAIARDPVFVDAWANLAKWQHLNGNIDEEKRLWKVVLTMDPSHPMARQVLHIAP